MKIAKRLLSLIFVISIAFTVINANHVLAGSLWSDQEGMEEIEGVYGSDANTDPRIIVANVIKVALGFLGIVLVVLLIWAGYKYMMAAGDDSKVTEAKTQIKNAIIGLIIILVAYSITVFVLDKIQDAVNDYTFTIG